MGLMVSRITRNSSHMLSLQAPVIFKLQIKVISNISILVDDAETLFHDRQAFGTALVPPEKFDELTKLDIFRNITFTKD